MTLLKTKVVFESAVFFTKKFDSTEFQLNLLSFYLVFYYDFIIPYLRLFLSSIIFKTDN